ncbi:MAG: TadE/TadG family type IV pilus assembly protein [Pseudomonadota bacterium]
MTSDATFDKLKRHLRAAGFFGCQRGLAALEFALIAPVMVFMFFAIVEGADALTASRRMTLAANTLADLVAQEAQITTSELNGLFRGVELISGADDNDIDFTVVSVVFDPDDNRVEVAWSLDDDGGAPYAADTPYTNLPDDTLLDSASSLIVAETAYDYTSELSKVLVQSIRMERTATRWPRQVTEVRYCGPSC